MKRQEEEDEGVQEEKNKKKKTSNNNNINLKEREKLDDLKKEGDTEEHCNVYTAETKDKIVPIRKNM